MFGFSVPHREKLCAIVRVKYKCIHQSYDEKYDTKSTLVLFGILIISVECAKNTK
jgi:hypothetical protein